ncbi:hypothetical protein FGO68_gene15008 [Halteria grandinella]|uniref:Uncharacterized protein n=1 Tax=Halteria grandinella TaxID=5974 RepID=A0A8J8SYG8_HALGN|nr:hypothetical protein FGO68_gene15008 [Halteria grandinella]
MRALKIQHYQQIGFCNSNNCSVQYYLFFRYQSIDSYGKTHPYLTLKKPSSTIPTPKNPAGNLNSVEVHSIYQIELREQWLKIKMEINPEQV